MEENSLVLKPINELLKESFFIPSYQRGYRWNKTQVENLLNDILEFKESQDKSKDPFYCLQPLIVSKQGDDWILVDGQQRLTTIHLICTCLKNVMVMLEKKPYKLKYETREESEDFLNNIDKSKKYNNIDYFHLVEAYETIEEWFGGRDSTFREDFVKTLLRESKEEGNVQVIWYEIKSKDAVEVFTRINIGKIPLTNAELIKALFLKKDNFNNNQDNIYLKQLEIATEWDRIESKFQDDNFWYFINKNPDKYDTRIEFIFDLMKDKKEDTEDYFTFYEFQKDFTGKNIDVIWKEIKQYFMTIEQWYHNKEFYHLVGYLIQTKWSSKTLKTLIDKAKKETKTEFKKYLEDEIIKSFEKVNVGTLEYGNTHIKNILLLFNIQTIINNEKSSIRFPFDEYKKQKWDIEHIKSRKSDKPTKKKDQKGWLEEIHNYNGCDFSSEKEIKELENSITKLLKKNEFSEEEFDSVYNSVLKKFKEDDQDDSIDPISNLTLLDAHTNRSYKNKIFPLKRQRIIENDRKGIFVPICTKNVFLKYYSKKPDGLMFWQGEDAENYLEEIKKTLEKYISKPNK